MQKRSWSETPACFVGIPDQTRVPSSRNSTHPCHSDPQEVPVAAIMISDLIIRNEEAFQTYRTRAAKAIAKFGGKYLARNGEIRVLEGQWQPNTIVVVEFPSLEQAQAWYQSPEYSAAL